MTTLSKTKRKLLNELRDVETRQIFQSEHNAAAIPIQIRELRKKRKLTQKELGALTGMDQGTISDLENPNYEYTPQIGTLERLANAYDVPLIVRFGSWSELWDWEHNLSAQRLAPGTFEEALPEIEASIQEEVTEHLIATPGSGKTALFLGAGASLNTSMFTYGFRGAEIGIPVQRQFDFIQAEPPYAISKSVATPAEVVNLEEYKNRLQESLAKVSKDRVA